MAAKYYQVGGWKADYPWGQQSWNPDYRNIWNWCGGSERGLDMVLGILPNGASSLLVPTYRALSRANSHKQACEFLSLSPIHFDNVGELKTKLEWLKPRRTGSKAKKGKDMDTSSANQGYYVTISSDGGRAVTERGWQRAAFEHSRILYRILRHDLDPVNLGFDRRYRRDILGDIQFVALALNYWAEDLGWIHDAEMLQLLDVGYTMFRVARNDQTMNGLMFGETRHLTCEDTSALKKKGLERLPAAPGPQTISQTLSLAELSSNIRAFFTALKSSPEPVVILAYDEAPLRTDVDNRSLVGAALQKLGVDTLKWKKVPQDGGFFKYDDPRARSRSPRRTDPRDTSSSRDPRARPQRSPSPSTLHDIRPRDIYCVDVSQMINVLNPVNGKDLSLPQMAHCLGLGDTRNGWCAGTEAKYLARLWLELAKGAPVDDQATQREAQFDTLPSKRSMQSADEAPIEHSGNAYDDQDYDDYADDDDEQ